MPRTRQISPDFFLNEELAECDPEARILFIGLWCLADREGKLKDKPRKVAAMVLPYTACNTIELLEQLHKKSLIVRYEVDGENYISIPNFCKRQKIHPHEAKSLLPNPLGQNKSNVTACSANGTANNPLPSCTSLPSCTYNNTSTIVDVCDTASADSPSADCGKSKIYFPIKDGKTWDLPQRKLDEYLANYSDRIDVLAEFRKAYQWLRVNKPKRKSAGGMPKFLTLWLNNSYDTHVATVAGGTKAEDFPTEEDVK